MGFEPMTPCLQGRCSPSWATPPYVASQMNCASHMNSLRDELASPWSIAAQYLGFAVFSSWTPKLILFVSRTPRVKNPSKLNNEPKRFHSLVWLPTSCLLVPILHRKEVIQPHLPIRLPCYDLTPIIEPTFGHCLLAVSAWTSGVPNFHGLTGGVYKARERIHRGMLIRDY